MNDLRHNERLLSDVLDEGASAGFRAAMLGQTLRLARRRRRVRQLRAGIPALAILAAMALLVWHQIPMRRSPTAPPAKPYTLVRTQPLAASAWVVTKPLSLASVVASVSSSRVILTAQAHMRARPITDEELLALVPKPAALVRRGPHSAELVFVNQQDQEELLRN